ncbi:hypothetical protein [Roseococcus pinisoli]|uniref:Lipoprotein n=1 Tax=Roseococcus pinisoli TaxID=2835040 RepID=A0ABS5QAY4_9PROT|nr:hypothetical protein [Roseococcus pinisoli]MBS7810861.1 hypothetical protein [Roseococcus pinisoli]
MRATCLTVLTAASALLGACASQEIRSGGGDTFLLQTTGLNGSRAVERGLVDARDFCAAQGRDFLVQDRRVGSGRYQLQFRCTAPFGMAAANGVDPLLAAAARPVVREPAELAARRRSRPSAAPEQASTEPARPRRARAPRTSEPVAENAPLEPLPAYPTLPARFARPAPEPQGLPPVSTTPLFNPRGASFPPPAPTVTSAPARQVYGGGQVFAPVTRTDVPRAALNDGLPPIAAQPSTPPEGFFSGRSR